MLSDFLIKRAPDGQSSQPLQTGNKENDFFDTVWENLLEKPAGVNNDGKSGNRESDEELAAAISRISQLEGQIKELKATVELLQAQQSNWGDIFTQIGLKVAALEKKFEWCSPR